MNVVLSNAHTEILMEDGILHSVFKPNLIINLEIARALVDERLKISKGMDQLLLFDISNLVSVDLEAIQYLSTKEALQCIVAGAIYSSNPIAKFAGKIFIDINQPKPPAKLFNDKREAVMWLYQFK